MSHFKQKHKDYLIKNEIKDLTDLVNYVEILRNTSNLQGEDRQMLFDFAFLIVNEQSSLKSFFAENKNPSKEFYNAFKQNSKNEDRYERVRANFHRKLLAPTIKVCEFNSIEDAKKYFNSTDYTEAFYYTYTTNELIESEEKSKNSPTFMDEVLEQANKEKWNPLDELHKRASQEMFNTIKDEDGQFNSTRHKSKEGETHAEVPNFNMIDIEQILPWKTHETISWQGEPVTMKEMFSKIGKKEKEGKLHYELSWEFIEEMAKRMANNKSDKYPLYNWKKDINVQDLKDAINRHHIEVMKGNYKDGDEILGHIVQYACNSMMLWEQLRDK